MSFFTFTSTGIFGLTLIQPFCAPDDRGYLSKPFEKSIFEEHGIFLSPWEELRSYSHKGVLRGLHFQRRHSQDKLVQVLRGAVYDVAVDLRENSPTFGKWEGFELTAENRKMLYIPICAGTDMTRSRTAASAGTTRSWPLPGRWTGWNG